MISVDKFIKKYNWKFISDSKRRRSGLTAFLDQEVREPAWVVRPLPERIDWEEVKAHIPDWYDAVGVAAVNSLKDTPWGSISRWQKN